MKAVIMAGGEGSRLRPLTCDRPKPMVSVLNRPCIEHTVNLLREQEIREIAVTLQYLPEKIQEYFNDGSSFGVDLHYFIETTPLGTAGSVKNAVSFLDETFIVISGDAITDCNLVEAFKYHKAKGALATIVLNAVPCPLEYGVVITSEDGKITRFLEKPGWSEVFSDQVNTGIYIIEPEVLNFIEDNKMVDFSKDIFPRLLAEKKALYAYRTTSYWCDIGNIREYLRAHYDLLDRKAKINFPYSELQPGVWVGKGVKIDSDARLFPPLMIGDESIVDGGSTIGPYAVLGSRVRVAERALIQRSVLWNDAWVGKGAVLRGTVAGKAVSIQAGAALSEATVVGDRSVIGEKAVVKTGVKIWPEKWVEKGSTIWKSVIWGSCVRSSLFGGQGVRGDLNVDIGPELACRLGLAAGSALVLPAVFALSSDGSPAALMIKQGILSGLLATGVKVVDLGNLPIPVHRFAVRSLQLKGGVHVSLYDQEKVSIRLFNAQGIDYPRNEQRKLEGLLSREEFRRAVFHEVASLSYQPDIIPMYLNSLLSSLDRDAIKRARFRVIADYQQQNLAYLLVSLFSSLGCQLLSTTNSEDGPQVLSDIGGVFGAKVKEQKASFGVILDPSGEEFQLFDDQGRLLSEDLLVALFAYIVLSENPRATIALPVTASCSIEEMAKSYGGSVRRTKVAFWEVMQAIQSEELRSSQNRYPQSLFFGDAIAMLAVIMDYLAGKEKLLSEVIGEIPPFSTVRKEVPVRWEDKGKVLRALNETTAGLNVEMIDGIKIYHPQGWVLVLPDADEPYCKILSESSDQEIAESLTDFYDKKIKELCNSEE